MNKKISLFILIILTISLFGSSPTPVHAQDWWNNNWSYRIMIEIDRDKIDADLTDFPVLVYLNSSRINWTHVQDDLDDLRFIDGDDITQLYAELENYMVNDEAWIWVKIPSIIMGETNQLFYLYYGNNAVSSWWNPEDMWEDSAVMVQHMRDNPDNAHITDSTQYDNDGTKLNPNEPIETASGKIDGAQDFDGGNDYINCGKSNLFDFGTSPFTISCMIFSPNTLTKGVNTDSTFIGKGLAEAGASYPGFRIYFDKWYGIDFEASDGVVGDNGIWNNLDVIANTWYILTAVKSGTTFNLFVNGVKYTATKQNLSVTNINVDFYIGCTFDYQRERFFGGTIDEVRVYNEAKSDEWILADYYSGSDNLLMYGAEELCPLALTILYNTGINKLYINGTERANNTTIYVDKNVNVNATVTVKPNFIFMKYALGSTGASLIPTYIFNMTNPFTLWSYATPNFYIYEEPTTFTFSQWMILLFVALGISLLAAIKFHIIATVSFILVIYMVINVASFTGMILLAIIVWLLTIMFSIIAFGEI